MPANNARDTMIRHWELLKKLPTSGAGKTVSELTNDLNALSFKVSKRQVERDLKQLQSVMQIECNDKSKPYGWRWVKGASRHIAAMSLPEALSWQLVSDTIKPLLPLSILGSLEPHFLEAKQKLCSLENAHPAAKWTQKIRVVQPSLPLIAPVINLSVLEVVQQALLKQQQIEVDYHSAANPLGTTRTLHPLALVQRGLVSYLVATVAGYTDTRIFALHRIKKAELMEHEVQIPTGFNIDAYIQAGALHFGNGDNVDLEIRVSDWLKKILEETPLSHCQTISTINQQHIIKASVSHTVQLEWWLLSQAEAVEVLQPSWLRENIHKRLLLAAKQYK